MILIAFFVGHLVYLDTFHMLKPTRKDHTQGVGEQLSDIKFLIDFGVTTV